MDQRISLVTLGVDDLDRSRAFYAALGWAENPAPEGIAFYQAGPMVVALWERAALAVDSGVDDVTQGQWGGITLALNVDSPARVDEIMEEAEASGARTARPAGSTFWGGYAGVFCDPDDHPWEIAYNPYWTVTEDGRTLLGDGRG